MTLFEVEEVMLLMDNDAFDNLHKPERAKSFFGAVRNFWFATQNATLTKNTTLKNKSRTCSFFF